MPQQINLGHGDGDNRGAIDGDSAIRAVAVERNPRRGRARTVVLLSVLLILIGVMCGFTTNFIPSNSMEPTLNPGDHILTIRRWLAYPLGSQPRRGDIIVFKLLTSRVTNADNALGIAPDDTSGDPKVQILIKRVIATGGDKVRVSGNKVFVNDIELHENHAVTPIEDPVDAVYVYADGEDYKLPKGQLFVLGDNRNTSEDSRYWGPLDEKDVMGKFVRILYNEGEHGPNESRDPDQKSTK